MRTALWFSSFGIPRTGLLLPYTAQSPSLFKRMEYKNEEDVYDEIDRILSEKNIQKFGIGKSLFYQMPFFCEPSLFLPNWCWEMIEDYHLTKAYNIPLSSSLEDANAWICDCFLTIEDEFNKIKEHKLKKDSN